VRSVASVALQCLRMLEELLLRGATHNVTVRTGTEIALYVLNHKRAHLHELEQRFRITVTVKADATPSGQPFVIEKVEQVHSLEQARALAAQPTALVPLLAEEEEADETAEFEGEDVSTQDEEEEADRAEAGEDGGRRRRRRRRRGRRDERPEAGPLTAAPVAEPAVPHEDHDSGEDGEMAATPRTPEHPGEQEAGDVGGADQRRRRRRGRRGGRRNRRPEGEAGASSVADETAGPVEHEIVEASADLEGVSFEFGQAASEPAPETSRQAPADELPRFRDEGEQAPLLSDQGDATARLSLAADEIVIPSAAPAETSEEAHAPAELEPLASSRAAPRRRSTVREPVGVPIEGSVPAEQKVAPGASAADTAEPPKGEPSEAASAAGQGGSRRTGWWARRLIGGNKG
jgi:ribonuclease E